MNGAEWRRLFGLGSEGGFHACHVWEFGRLDQQEGGVVTFAVMLLALCVAAVLFGVAQRAQAAGLAVDASVKTHQGSPSASITSGAISTTAANDLLVAFITSDGPAETAGQSFSSVTGGGLTWKLRERENAQAGTAEIWEAVAPSPLSNVTVAATRSNSPYVGSIDVVAFSGADTTVDGAVAGNSAASGAPSVSLTATRTGSWVWGVGNDWNQAIRERPAAGRPCSTNIWRRWATRTGFRA